MVLAARLLLLALVSVAACAEASLGEDFEVTDAGPQARLGYRTIPDGSPSEPVEAPTREGSTTPAEPVEAPASAAPGTGVTGTERTGAGSAPASNTMVGEA